MSIYEQKSSESSEIKANRPELTPPLTIKIIHTNTEEDLATPENSIPKSNGFFDHDFNSSSHLSLNSSLLTEDLIINEDIDFLLNASSSDSSSISLTYTKSELASRMSSIFHSFEGSNVLMNSVPHSNNESLTLNRKSYESMDPRHVQEISDFKMPYLKIPHLSHDFRVNPVKILIDVGDNKLSPTASGMPAELSLGIQANYFKDTKQRELFGKARELIIERQTTLCSCVWCSIV